MKLVFAICILLGSSTVAQAANGMDLYNMCGHNPSAFFHKPKCQIYVGDAVNSIVLGPHPTICFPANFDPRQTLPIVQKFMRDRPETLNNSGPEVIRLAMHDAYPCR
jgi:hypothetical protein